MDRMLGLAQFIVTLERMAQVATIGICLGVWVTFMWLVLQ